MQRIYVQSTLVQAIASPSKREIALLLQVPASPPVQEHFRFVQIHAFLFEFTSLKIYLFMIQKKSQYSPFFSFQQDCGC